MLGMGLAGGQRGLEGKGGGRSSPENLMLGRRVRTRGFGFLQAFSMDRGLIREMGFGRRIRDMMKGTEGMGKSLKDKVIPFAKLPNPLLRRCTKMAFQHQENNETRCIKTTSSTYHQRSRTRQHGKGGSRSHPTGSRPPQALSHTAFPSFLPFPPVFLCPS